MSTKTTISQETFEMYAAICVSLERHRSSLDGWISSRERGANATVLPTIQEAVKYLAKKEEYSQVVDDIATLASEMLHSGMPTKVWVKYTPQKVEEEDDKPWKIKLVTENSGDVKLHIKRI